jgi:hypothetical protein
MLAQATFLLAQRYFVLIQPILHPIDGDHSK